MTKAALPIVATEIVNSGLPVNSFYCEAKSVLIDFVPSCLIFDGDWCVNGVKSVDPGQ